MVKRILAFLSRESGATAIEYGLIAGLVFLVIVGSVQLLSQGVIDTLYAKIATAL